MVFHANRKATSFFYLSFIIILPIIGSVNSLRFIGRQAYFLRNLSLEFLKLLTVKTILVSHFKRKSDRPFNFLIRQQLLFFEHIHTHKSPMHDDASCMVILSQTNAIITSSDKKILVRI